MTLSRTLWFDTSVCVLGAVIHVALPEQMWAALTREGVHDVHREVLLRQASLDSRWCCSRSRSCSRSPP